MADQESLSTASSGDHKELADAFGKVDLDFDYWFPHFQRIGLHSASHLRHAGKYEFEQLCKEKSHRWEEDSLQKLLKPNKFEMFSNKDWGKDDIVSIAHFIRQEVLPLMGTMQAITFSERNREFADLMKKITADLKTKGKLWDHIILKLCLFCEQYDDERHIFDKTLQEEDVNRLAHILIAFNSNVKEIRDNTSYDNSQTQAALLRFVIQNSNFAEKTKRKAFLDEVIHSIGILDPVKQIIDRFSRVQVWEELDIDLLRLINGDEVLENKSGIDVLIHILQNNINYQVLSWMGVENDANKNNPESLVQENPVNDILSKLGLLKYFPNKIDLHTAMAKDLKIDAKNKDPEIIAWLFIRSLVTLNPEEVRKVVNVDKKFSSEKAIEDGSVESLFGDSFPDSSDSLHPSDILLAVLLCCDHQLRKLLYQKMFLCKFAFPIITLHSGSLTVNMWALRSVTVEYYDLQQRFQEGSCVDLPIDIVSTFSLGKTVLDDSNVKLFNGIITESKHSVFFHRDCLTSASKQTVEGFIEGTLAMPTDKTRFLNKLTCFCNFSGNIDTYRSLFDLYLAMSHVFIILLDVQDLEDAKIIRTLIDIGHKLVLVLNNSTNMSRDHMIELVKKYSTEYETHTKEKPCTIIGINKPEQEMVKLLRDKIFDKLERNKDHDKSFQLIMNASRTRFPLLLDEDEPACKKGEFLAEICKADFNDNDFKRGRTGCLPLHGKEWHAYSKYLKEERRFSGEEEESALEFQENIKMKRFKQRYAQKEMLKKSLFCSKHFLNIIANCDNDMAMMNFFFQWLKLKLDKKSLDVLPGQQEKCKEAWQKYRKAKDDKNTEREVVAQLFDDVKNCDEELSNGVIGLEHMFREIGQTYEVTMFACDDPSIKSVIKKLPLAMAKLFLNGNTLELLDGDAANAPLQWLEAVFSELKTLIGNKKIFVVSILGVQSSGKSTLLNTMFGLKFPVSAGRCTKGICAQLFPLDNRMYDYILVLDTEGLRAPELALDTSSCARDNELATLAIGMADLTIVNIKGENTEEMRNCLQIAMHAFVRMKMTAKKIKDKQQCIFVHNNVSAISAKDKTRSARQKLEEVLDRLFEEAVKQEKCKEVVSFRDVLQFDGEIDIWFLSDLWHGDPPLAPINPGYAQQVAKVRQCIVDKGDSIDHLQNIWKCFVSFKDLWDAILEEDFIFSYRNSLEVKAYRDILKAYLAIRRTVNDNITDWLELNAQSLIKECKLIDEITEIQETVFDQLKEKLDDEKERARIKLLKCFEIEEIKEMAIRWKENKLIELSEHCNLLHLNAKQFVEEFREERHLEIINGPRLDEFKVTMQRRAIDVAKTLKTANSTDAQIKEEFENLWTKWWNDMPSSNSRTEVVNVSRVIRQAVDDLFETDHNLVKDLLVDTSINEYNGSPNISLAETIEKSCIIHKQKKCNLVEYLAIFEDSSLLDFLRILCEKADKKLDRWRKVFHDGGHETVHKFKRKHIDDLILMMHDGIERHNEKQSSLELNRSQAVKLVLLLCQVAFPVFRERQRLYEERFTISTQLNQFKNMLSNFFKNAVRKTESDMAAGMIVDSIKKPLFDNARRTLFSEIVQTTISHLGAKWNFLVRIMEYLLKKGSFKEYILYIEDPSSLGEDYIEILIQNTWLDDERGEKCPEYKTRFIELLTMKCKHLRTIIVQNEAKLETKSYLPYFIKEIRNMIPEAINVFKIFDCPSIGDIKHLKAALVTEIDKIEIELKEEVRTPKYTPQEYVQKVMREVWGCREVCPFCREPCNDSSKGSHVHSCIQHRPEGLMGQYWIKTNKLVINPCSYSIFEPTTTFLCTKRCHSNAKPEKQETRRHSYQDYQSYFKNWNIPATANTDICRYWCFVMEKYKDQFAKYHNRLVPLIPSTWQHLTEKDALASLK